MGSSLSYFKLSPLLNVLVFDGYRRLVCALCSSRSRPETLKIFNADRSIYGNSLQWPLGPSVDKLVFVQYPVIPPQPRFIRLSSNDDLPRSMIASLVDFPGFGTLVIGPRLAGTHRHSTLSS